MQLLCKAASGLSPNAGLHHRLMQALDLFGVDAQMDLWLLCSCMWIAKCISKTSDLPRAPTSRASACLGRFRLVGFLPFLKGLMGRVPLIWGSKGAYGSNSSS